MTLHVLLLCLQTEYWKHEAELSLELQAQQNEQDVGVIANLAGGEFQGVFFGFKLFHDFDFHPHTAPHTKPQLSNRQHTTLQRQRLDGRMPT